MIDWANLPFGYLKTKSNTRCLYSEGKWGKMEVTESENINMHMAATCLHYGQECFEGLKAYRGKDGKIRVFRWEENSKRLNRSAARVGMPEVPAELFKEMLFTLVKENADFVPPYGTGASLYIRPLMIGMSPRLGISASTEVLLILFCSPVGPYYKGGFNFSAICNFGVEYATGEHILLLNNDVEFISENRRIRNNKTFLRCIFG